MSVTTAPKQLVTWRIPASVVEAVRAEVKRSETTQTAIVEDALGRELAWRNHLAAREIPSHNVNERPAKAGRSANLGCSRHPTLASQRIAA
jgi:hypothetical protein